MYAWFVMSDNFLINLPVDLILTGFVCVHVCHICLRSSSRSGIPYTVDLINSLITVLVACARHICRSSSTFPSIYRFSMLATEIVSFKRGVGKMFLLWRDRRSSTSWMILKVDCYVVDRSGIVFHLPSCLQYRSHPIRSRILHWRSVEELATLCPTRYFPGHFDC